MRIAYIADDGKEFDDEFECLDYEWGLYHSNLKDVHFYDKDDNELGDIYSEDTYSHTEKIITLTDDAVKDLQKLADYTGNLCYGDVTKKGTWVFDDKKCHFVLIKEEV